jgi:hypothetical protein
MRLDMASPKPVPPFLRVIALSAERSLRRRLTALILDLVEQPHVLDGDYRLVGEGLGQPDLLGGERPDAPSHQGEYTDSRTLTHHCNIIGATNNWI